MKTCNRAHESLVEDILRHELRNDVRLVPIPTYPDTIVYEAFVDDRTLVFKATEPEGRDRDGIGLEAWTCDTARGAGVPAPQVLLTDTSRERFPSSFFVMEKAAGAPLERLSLPEFQVGGLLAGLGSHLRALHDIAVPGFGWLDEATFQKSGEVRGWAETWRHALLDEVPESLEYLARPSGLSAVEVARAGDAIEAGARFIDAYTDGRLLHGDLGLLHVWVDPETLRITSLIDFGERCSGDPAFDFGDLDMRQVREVLAGYDPDDLDAVIERVRFYRLVQAVPWARKWHARGETQVLDWLRSLLDGISD